MQLETYKQTYETKEYIPLEDPIVLETARDDVLAVETTFDDPELQQLAADNTIALRQGEIAIDRINSLEPRKDGYAFKILRADEDEAHVAGVVYVVKKGLDSRTVELAYYTDEKEQGNGLMSVGVAAVGGHFNKTKDLKFEIHNNNEASIRVARKLGAAALGVNGDHMNYYVDRGRIKAV
jgi:RimJ/RimL family protein N-acetyltransferase